MHGEFFLARIVVGVCIYTLGEVCINTHEFEGQHFCLESRRLGAFPDLPGVISAGKTLDEARDMGAEALALHLEGLAADGEAAPEPSSLEEIMKDAQNRDGVAVLIAAPAADVKSVRINVTMPADVLDQIDRYAEREGFTRSGFLAQAAKKAMAG